MRNIDCINGKKTRHISKKPATRSNELLELIHIDTCGPFDILSWAVKSISSLLSMTSHDIVTFFCSMKSP